MSFIKNFLKEEDGQDMVEYGLVISLVVIGGVTAYTAFGTSINNAIGTVATSITSNL
jgi:Flp pilus assembly pilin Flp